MPGPTPAVAAVRSAVRASLAAQRADGGAPAGALVLVACSGGPDSLALASQAAFVAPRLGLRAGAVVVDHGMQPGSGEVAESAGRTCAALGLDPVLVRPVDEQPPGEQAQGTEGRARTLRYRVLEQVRAQTGAVAILLGHTLDDQAETVLLALGRGSGTRSVAGMAAVRGPYRRPLLGVRRADTLQVCSDLGLDVYVDPSNAVDGPWRRHDGGPVPRAAVRDRVLPELAVALGRDPAPALARTAGLARADADLLDALADDAWRRCAADPTDAVGPAVRLDAAALAAEPPALRTRVLHRAALAAGAPAGDLLHQHVRALEDLVVDWHGQGEVHLPGGAVARRDCGRLVLASGQPPRTQ